ncbi:MAG: hypothetical protein M3O66_01635 [Verrucomicrobiota bacterium]|nr:hypothetical protein [Verrucomicrobiota bacterium]
MSAIEMHLALAPRVTLGGNLPVFSEDNVHFYGTNLAVLTSNFLRARAETQVGKKVPSGLRIEAKHIPNTSIISITASGADDSTSMPFLSALIDQFLRFKREQKEKYYHDAIAVLDSALSYAPADCMSELKTYKNQLVIASLWDVKSDFEKVDY